MACQCLRVDQLDAHVLDGEIRTIAQDSVDEVVNQMPVWVARIFERMRPELKVTLEAVLWTHRFSRGASVGQEQMDIAYTNYTRNRIGGHFFVEVLIPYITSRMCELSGRIDLARIHGKLEAVYETVSLVHLLNFLRSGGHSSVVESVLSLRNWNNNLPTIGSINYDNQNRELIWHAFRDVILLVYPFVDKAHRRYVRNQKMANKFTSSESSSPTDCVVCDKPAVIPMVGHTCCHVACYTCVATSSRSNSCPLCGAEKMEFLAKSENAILVNHS